MTAEQHNTLTPYLSKWQTYQKDSTLRIEPHEMAVIHGVFIELNPAHPYTHKRAISCANCRLAIFKDVFREYDKFQEVELEVKKKRNGRKTKQEG